MASRSNAQPRKGLRNQRLKERGNADIRVGLPREGFLIGTDGCDSRPSDCQAALARPRRMYECLWTAIGRGLPASMAAWPLSPAGTTSRICQSPSIVRFLPVRGDGATRSSPLPHRSGTISPGKHLRSSARLTPAPPCCQFAWVLSALPLVAASTRCTDRYPDGDLEFVRLLKPAGRILPAFPRCRRQAHPCAWPPASFPDTGATWTARTTVHYPGSAEPIDLDCPAA